MTHVAKSPRSVCNCSDIVYTTNASDEEIAKLEPPDSHSRFCPVRIHLLRRHAEGAEWRGSMWSLPHPDGPERGHLLVWPGDLASGFGRHRQEHLLHLKLAFCERRPEPKNRFEKSFYEVMDALEKAAELACAKKDDGTVESSPHYWIGWAKGAAREMAAEHDIAMRVPSISEAARELGRQGRASKTASQAKASRVNGRRGGRPVRTIRIEDVDGETDVHAETEHLGYTADGRAALLPSSQAATQWLRRHGYVRGRWQLSEVLSEPDGFKGLSWVKERASRSGA